VDASDVESQDLYDQLRAVGDEDAVQDGFLRIFQRSNCVAPKNLKAYWYSASKNALTDRSRRLSAERRAVGRLSEVIPMTDEATRWSEQQVRDLISIANDLSGRSRLLIALELQGTRNISELSDSLAMSEGATRTLRYRTYRQLRAALSRRWNEDTSKSSAA